MSTLYQTPAPGGFEPKEPASPAADAHPGNNVLGVIALVCAIAGLILSCIPGILLLGWILLPIGFILGIIALFLPAKKATAIAAIITSIVGALVAASVFVFVIGNAFEDAFDEDVTVSQGESSSAPTGTSGGAGEPGSTRENPLPIGATVENEEWAVTLNGVNPAATDEVLAENQYNEAPAPGQTYVLVDVSITYKGTNPQGEIPLSIIEIVTPDAATVSWFDAAATAPNNVDLASALYNGGTASGNLAFLVSEEAAQGGVIAIQPDPFAQKRFFSTH
ncbi:DUF4352 domain-containing protein [Corynebacterium liangguodongii]|nr:DUF4352 domain-containing protein [Corynebacterium liangguodongii]